ncbi:hypothetical protein [Flavobacterium sp. TAB 87]|uniref:hypothetical protein n=1 Tax=Flavobacterium sp. TAB 87 TaxID=1729581 RepID=UPI00076C26D3|nr:hypothetical protein [Flavobacterium sp. TAB 87]KVV15293.1 hypothetical protein AP058_01395 [Flavobacterium sp. TAB 87]
MKNINITNQTKYSLEFIFSEADKLATELTKSISENTNKSFFVVAFYSSILSFSFFQMAKGEYLYFILLAGCILSIIILHKNLFPSMIALKGSLPELMFDSYFDSFLNEELEKEYLATQIESYNYALNHNKENIKNMVNRFKKSIYCMLIFLFFFIAVTCFFSFVECFQC